MSRGLFKRAIMESGITLAPTFRVISDVEAVATSIEIAQALNCTQESKYLECLQSKSINELFNVNLPKYPRFMPCVDYGFLPQQPKDILEKGDFDHNLEIIIGSNSDEGSMWWYELLKDHSKFHNCHEFWEPCTPKGLYMLKDDSEVTDEITIKFEQ